MANEVIRVHARVCLLPTNEGGRNGPILGGTSWRPNHNFFGPGNLEMAVGLIDLPEGNVLTPGGTVDTIVIFLPFDLLIPELHPGREWLIQEGAQVVGTGRVLRVCD